MITDKQIQELFGQLNRFFLVTTPGGKVGDTLWFKINGHRKQGICYHNIQSGECLAVLADNNQYYLVNTQEVKPIQKLTRIIQYRRTTKPTTTAPTSPFFINWGVPQEFELNNNVGTDLNYTKQSWIENTLLFTRIYTALSSYRVSFRIVAQVYPVSFFDGPGNVRIAINGSGNGNFYICATAGIGAFSDTKTDLPPTGYDLYGNGILEFPYSYGKYFTVTAANRNNAGGLYDITLDVKIKLLKQ